MIQFLLGMYSMHAHSESEENPDENGQSWRLFLLVFSIIAFILGISVLYIKQ